jgi:VanZ family protein
MHDRPGMTLERAALGLGWLGLGSILVLSLVPGSERPHALSSGHAEHFLAYFATAACFSVGARSLVGRWTAFAVLSLVSAGVEVAQLWIPGRTGELDGVIFSSAGALAGIAAGLLAHRFRARPSLG